MALVLDGVSAADMAAIVEAWKEDVGSGTRTTRGQVRSETERLGAIAADREAAIRLSNDLNRSVLDEVDFEEEA